MQVDDKAFSKLLGQDGVKRFFTRSIESGQVSHAYLLLGKPGSGKTEAAYSFARALICPKGGCCACDACIRISRKTHPDVKYCSPAGVSGYVVEQIREILHEAPLSPIRSDRKIFIIDRADLLQGAAANALLKTLEEPPDGVVFLLLGRNRETIMPTILSRCQVVPFRTIPDTEACQMLMRSTGFDEGQCRFALAACAKSATRARNFLFSEGQRRLRLCALEALSDLRDCDADALLEYSERLNRNVLDGAEGTRRDLEKVRKEFQEFLSSRALKELEKTHSREITAAQRGLLDLVFNVCESWFMDCLAVAQGAAQSRLVNADVADSVFDAATYAGADALLCAYGAVAKAREQVAYNVTPRLVLDTMLICIKRGLNRTCSIQ